LTAKAEGPGRRFEFDDLTGAVAPAAVDGDLGAGFEETLRRLLDPGSGRRSLHWGRSYLYEAGWRGAARAAETAVVVKQFRHDDLHARLRRRRRGSRARLSFLAACRLRRLGIPTPEPLLYAESNTIGGPAWYVCRLVPEALELRYVLRALNAGAGPEQFPGIHGPTLLRRIGALAAELHRHGVWFRDLTSGNVLLSAPATDAELFLVDLNRARFRRRLSTSQRLRDLSRMPVLRPEDRAEYLAGYRPGGLPRFQRIWFEACHRGFRFKSGSKQGARRGLRRLSDLLLPRRRAHPHVPDAERGATATERTVWDPLTDQPHQQATRGQRLGVRLRDAGHHARPLLRSAVPLLLSVAEARSGRRALNRAPAPVRFGGLGVAIGPGSAPVASLAGAIEDLGVDAVLLRFHLWQGVDSGLLELARTLSQGERTVDLVFQLGQDRSLVRDGALWRRRVEEAAAALAPFGRRFLIGQAPNRSKWGVWRPGEYWNLLEAGAEAVRARRPDVCVLAPAVIDFEPHATAGLIHSGRPERRFDILASQLYVDRRGAPENRQLGFDLAGKLAVLRSLARRAPDCVSGRSWVTEFNWPLAEGPHAPAGRDVAVDEEAQASYLVRYALEALGSGLAERVYWWQLAAAGYGLLDPRGASLRRRPAYLALRQLQRELAGAEVVRLPMERGLRGYRAVRDGREVRVVWALDDRGRPRRPRSDVRAARDRDGRELDRAPAVLTGAPVYLEHETGV
jgi:tRNA A-37 threonylcarbamoyl transferase component Bud32